MFPKFAEIKGIHPGALLKRELKIQDLKGSELAASINEHKQTISAILNGRRDVNPQLSIKLSARFKVDEDYFMLLQASYNVKKMSERKTAKSPNIKNIRKALFWDTDFNKIDWEKNSKAVIKRVLERGNQQEINEIISFYGRNNILEQIKTMKGRTLPSFDANLKMFNLG